MAAQFPESIKSFTQVTDFVDDAEAVNINPVYDELESVESWLKRTLAIGHNATTLEMTTDLVLTDTDDPIWYLDPTTDLFGVTLPAASTDNHIFYLRNTGAGGLSVYSGTDVLETVGTLSTSIFISDAIDWSAVSGGGASVVNPNLLINGGMAISQRGTSFTAATTPANSDDTYLLDRWVNLSDGNDIVDVSQIAVTSDENPFAYQALVATANKKFGMLTVLETKDSPQIWQTVSLSFRAKTTAAAIRNVRAAVISWDGTADTVTSDVVSAWGAEGTNPTLAANWTYENTATDNLLTTSWQTFKIENISVDTALTKNVGVFLWVDDGDAAANDIVQIQWVKLELGSVATPFVSRPYAEELGLCQRYCYVPDNPLVYSTVGIGMSTSTTLAYPIINLQTEMRVPPAFSPAVTVTDWVLSNYTVATVCSEVVVVNGTKNNVVLQCTVASGLNAGTIYYLQNNNSANKIMVLSAEL